jgi:competence protein ComEA
VCDCKQQFQIFLSDKGGSMGNATRRLARSGWLLGLFLIAAAVDIQAQALPDGPGKDVVQQACSQCHGLRSVAVARHTRQEWDNVVTDMIGRGAAITDNEIPAIVDYLTRSFSKDSTSVNVNRATAKEFVDTLRLTAHEAEALVRHRDDNGYFNKFQDLERVAGVDIKKFESAKERLQF